MDSHNLDASKLARQGAMHSQANRTAKTFGESLEFEEQIKQGEIQMESSKYENIQNISPGPISTIRKGRGRGKGAVLPHNESSVIGSFPKPVLFQELSPGPYDEINGQHQPIALEIEKRALTAKNIALLKQSNDNKESKKTYIDSDDLTSTSSSDEKRLIATKTTYLKAGSKEENSFINSVSVKSGYDSKSCPVKIIEKPALKVDHHGCLSMADTPGRILARGPLLTRPLRKIDQLPYYENLKRGINSCGIEEMNFLQKAVAPHLIQGTDSFIFGGHACGKTLSYLMPLSGSLVSDYESNRSSKIQQTHKSGPLAIIISNDFRSALKIEGHLNNLLTSSIKHQIVACLICDDRKETRKKIELGVDVMVTTLKFVADNHYHFKFDRLKFFVFDDVDILLRSNFKDFEKIRHIVENFVLKSAVINPYQRIFCGHEWTSEVEDLYLNITGLPDPTRPALPVILIHSPNQALKYSKMPLTFHHIPVKMRKIDKALELLNSPEIHKHRDIFIVCSMPNVASDLHEELEVFGIHSYLAETENMDHSDLKQIKRRWEDYPHYRRIMVLHDQILRELDIHNVTCLIHYDLPIKKAYKTATGADRFSCMWGHFRDLSEEKLNPSAVEQRKNLESHFLLTGEEPELYKLKLFGEKMGCRMPDLLDKIAEEAGKKKLDEKPLCPKIMQFGKCTNHVLGFCSFRHHFLIKELERIPAVPRNSRIELRITKCENPSKYIGQVIRCTEVENGKIKLKSSFIKTEQERRKFLSEFFEIEENLVTQDAFNPGTLCAVQLPNEEGFTRAKIMHVMTRTPMNFPKTVRVFCVDTGDYLQPAAEDLFKLPKDYEEIPNLAVEIILANLKPPNGELDYREFSIQAAKQLTLDKILEGKVVFAIDSIVWLNPLVEYELDAHTKKKIKKQSIRLALMNWQNWRHAENNEEHTINLVQLFKDAGFSCPDLEDNWELDQNLPQFFKLGDEINWAFLQKCNDHFVDTTEVWASFTKDPYNIFGTVCKFEQQLEDLNNDVKEYASGMINETCKNYDNKFSNMYEIGLMVVAEDRLEKIWCRAIIIKQHDYEKQVLFDVFFVDIGDVQLYTTTKELLPIPLNLVTRLPCQIVGLHVGHVKPIYSSEWSREDEDETIGLTLNSNNDGVKLEVAALESHKHPNFPCRYYKAVVIIPGGDDIGESLVRSGHATYVDDQVVKSIKSRLLEKYNKMYDRQAVADAGDDDDEEEDFDSYNVVQRDPNQLQADFDEDSWDVRGFDINSFRELVGLPIPKNGYIKPSTLLNAPDANPVNPDVNQTGESESPSTSLSGIDGNTKNIQATSNLPTFSDILHPKVSWRQTKEDMILVVNHPDIKTYTLDVKKQFVSFRTIEPPDYGFDLELFGRVSGANEFLTGQYLRIKLKKRLKNWSWPQPLNEENKYPWFKQDIDYVDSSDEEEVEVDSEPEMVALDSDDNYQSSRDDDSSSLDSDDDPEETEKISVEQNELVN